MTQLIPAMSVHPAASAPPPPHLQDAASLAQCQDTAQPGVPYPALRRIEVLGWQRAAVNATLQVGTSVVTFAPDQVRRRLGSSLEQAGAAWSASQALLRLDRL